VVTLSGDTKSLVDDIYTEIVLAKVKSVTKDKITHCPDVSASRRVTACLCVVTHCQSCVCRPAEVHMCGFCHTNILLCHDVPAQRNSGTLKQKTH